MSPARRILILTNGPLCRNPRVVKEATIFSQAMRMLIMLGNCDYAAPLFFRATFLFHGR